MELRCPCHINNHTLVFKKNTRLLLVKTIRVSNYVACHTSPVHLHECLTCVPPCLHHKCGENTTLQLLHQRLIL